MMDTTSSSVSITSRQKGRLCQISQQSLPFYSDYASVEVSGASSGSGATLTGIST